MKIKHLIFGLVLASGLAFSQSQFSGGSGGNGSGGGGTVTNVTGTTNQIAVATGTTTPVISITSPVVFPGSAELASGNLFDWNLDTGLSRTSADNLAIGNGTQGDTSGNVAANEFNAVTSLSAGGANIPCGASCWGLVETSTAGTPTANGEYCRADSTNHFVCDIGTNGEYTSLMNLSESAASIVGLFSTCSGTQYLGADGACHTASGGSGDTITSPNSTLSVGGTTSATTLDLVGSAGKIMGGATPALTATPTLGLLGTTGSLTLLNTNGSTSNVITENATGLTVGTITSGTWNGTAIGTSYLAGSGATTVNGSTCTLGSSCTPSAPNLSISGQTGLLSFTGLTSTNRIKTVRDAADTLLELGGSYTPTGTWNWTSATATWPTFNQNTTGNAGTVTTAASTTNSSYSVLSAASASGSQAPATVASFTINPSTGNVNIPGTLTATQLISTVSTGTAPLAVSSTSNVANLNASSLNGATFSAPGAIGGGTAAAGSFTSENATTNTSSGQTKAAGFFDTSAVYTTSAMSAASSSSCATITDGTNAMQWSIAASGRYILQCEIPLTFATSATVGFCLAGPGTANSYSLSYWFALATATSFDELDLINQTAYATKTTASASPGAVTRQIHVRAQVNNGSTASGTQLALQTFANGTNNITVLADSACVLTQQH